MKQLLWLSGSAKGVTDEVFKLGDPSYFAPDDVGDGGEEEYPDYFRVPRGCKAKLWAVQLGGKPFSAQIAVSDDLESYLPTGPEFVHVTGTTEVTGEDTGVEVTVLAGFSNYRFGTRPLVIVESRNGTEAFRVGFDSPEEGAESSIGLLVEITDED